MNAVIDNPKFQEIDKKLNGFGFMLLYAAIKPDGWLSLYATPLKGVSPTIAAAETNNEILIQFDTNDAHSGNYSIEEAMNLAFKLDNALDAAQYIKDLVESGEIEQLEHIKADN